jgi:dynein heavy chain
LTAIKQVKGNSEGLELNKLTIKTELTNKSAEEVQGPPAKRDGAHIFGLFVEGARYDFNNKILEDSLPKQMFSLVPVIWAKAVLIKEGIVTGFGLSNDRTVYICPVYKTAFRLR